MRLVHYFDSAPESVSLRASIHSSLCTRFNDAGADMARGPRCRPGGSTSVSRGASQGASSHLARIQAESTDLFCTLILRTEK
jgi:hypothetical protein